MDAPRYPAADLVRFARVLLEHAGLDTEKALAVADILVEGDLLGHDTHGLQLLPAYLQELQTGGMHKAGAPRVLRDKPAALTWDAQRLPGPWVVLQAIDEALMRIEKGSFGICKDCGEPIAEARLNAIPWTRVCITCKEKQKA